MPSSITRFAMLLIAPASFKPVPFRDEDRQLRLALKAMAAAGKFSTPVLEGGNP